MALKNLETNEYIKIYEVKGDYVYFYKFKDLEQRQRWERGEYSPYETNVGLGEPAFPNLNALADPAKSIKENIVTAGYEALKLLPEYQNMQDC